ncbi:MAG TPA: alanine--tRNA ligase [Candidatus Tyrphobacter sp.]
MRSQELRQAFVDFFVSKGHVHLPSASLIPDEMSTTLFTIAGMEQFVPVFLGDRPAPAPRAVTVQRCLRVAGAKSDIENVGRTGRHGTFLEMLGNFSFGDYYKREAIAYAWEFSTRVLELDPAKLYVTVHTGDEEAERIWREEIGLESSRITRCEEENFWTMGPTGPCGPSTELFYDSGPENASSPADTGPNKGDRYIEFWNVVFQEFNRGTDGHLSDLPRKAIDTGAGLERMLAICNGKVSMYETDLFTDLIAALPDGSSSASPLRDSVRDDRDVRRNVIADHARAVTFLINDGIFPSNTDRGYVLRFLIRRAVRNGRLLGYPSGFLSALVPAVVASLSPGYPELRAHQERIERALAQEEASFERTLERGMAMLDRLLDDAREKGATRLPGMDVFTLHDTYGFPMELTREIAGERGVAIDEAAFHAEMEKQRERARRDAEKKRAVVTLAELPAITSDFTGYEGLESEGEIVALLRDEKSVDRLAAGERGAIVLDRSSFYAERGGQIGDRGTILSDNLAFDVQDTQYLGDAIAHYGVVVSGEAAVGEQVRSVVHDWWRREIRRHHTSAHLLQRALKDVLGEDVAQAGSWVGFDKMRFDFRWTSGSLTQEQRLAVAQRVNEMIRDDSVLVTRELPVEEAKSTGAIWMFGEKYGERVRVVQAGPSIEFCGGTHSRSTGELGLFVILSEFSIGSGIRRIESCVSASAESFVERQQTLVGNLAASLATTPDKLGERVSSLQRDVKDLQTAVGQLRARLAAADAQEYVAAAERKGDRTFVGAVVPEATADALRHLSQAIRTRLRSGVIALAGVDGDGVSLLVTASEDLVKSGVHAGNLVKLATPLVDGKGGGQAAQAQGGGRKADGASAAIRAIRDAVLES